MSSASTTPEIPLAPFDARGGTSEFVPDGQAIGAGVTQIVDRCPEPRVAVELLLVLVLVGQIAPLERDLEVRISEVQRDTSAENAVTRERAELIGPVIDRLCGGRQQRRRRLPGINESIAIREIQVE